MPNTTGKDSGSSILAIVTAWVIAAVCLGLCATAISLWETDLAIRRRLPDMGYNEILKLRDDAWLQFRATLAWTLTAMSVATAGVGLLPALLVRRPGAWIASAIAAVVSMGTLGYMFATR
jgi:hypothetical protein